MKLLKFEYSKVFNNQSINFQGQQLLTRHVAIKIQSRVHIKVAIEILSNYPNMINHISISTVEDATLSN